MIIKDFEIEKRNFDVGKYFSTKTKFWDVVYDTPENLKETASHQRADMVLRQETALEYLDVYPERTSNDVLDIGCGTGVLLEKMSLKGYKVTGIDISPGMLAETVKKIKRHNLKNAKCFNSEVEDMPFDDNEFNVVTCLGVLEYLTDDDIALSEIARVLKPNGVLIISAPNLFKLKNFFDPNILFIKGSKYLKRKKIKHNKNGKNIKEISTNENFANKRYRLNQLKKLFAVNGFSLVDFEAIGFGPLTLFNKRILPLNMSLNLNDVLNKLAIRSNFLKHFSNRWVFCLRKI